MRDTSRRTRTYVTSLLTARRPESMNAVASVLLVTDRKDNCTPKSSTVLQTF